MDPVVLSGRYVAIQNALTQGGALAPVLFNLHSNNVSKV